MRGNTNGIGVVVEEEGEEVGGQEGSEEVLAVLSRLLQLLPILFQLYVCVCVCVCVCLCVFLCMCLFVCVHVVVGGSGKTLVLTTNSPHTTPHHTTPHHTTPHHTTPHHTTSHPLLPAELESGEPLKVPAAQVQGRHHVQQHQNAWPVTRQLVAVVVVAMLVAMVLAMIVDVVGCSSDCPLRINIQQATRNNDNSDLQHCTSSTTTLQQKHANPKVGWRKKALLVTSMTTRKEREAASQIASLEVEEREVKTKGASKQGRLLRYMYCGRGQLRWDGW